MENQASSKSVILNYGLYYGIASVLVSVIFYALNMHLQQGLTNMFIGLAVMLAFIILAQKKFKLDNNNILSFWQAVKIGMGTVLIGALISIVYNQIFINFIEPDFMNQAMNIQEQALVDRGLSSDQVDAQMEIARNFSGPLISSAFIILAASFFSFILSMITGAVMKRTEEDGY